MTAYSIAATSDSATIIGLWIPHSAYIALTLRHGEYMEDPLARGMPDRYKSRNPVQLPKNAE